MLDWQTALSQHGFFRADRGKWLHERWENSQFYVVLHYSYYGDKFLVSINLGIKGIWPSVGLRYYPSSSHREKIIFDFLKALQEPCFLPLFINEPLLKPFLDMWFRHE